MSAALRLNLLFLLAVSTSFVRAQEGPSVEQPHVSVSLVADTAQIAPGQSFYLGVEYAMEDTWHIYWKNPGDAGIPTEISWDFPEGFTVGPLQWPTPKTYQMGGLMNYVHEGTVILMAKITAPETLPQASEITFKARSDWLICKDICVPGGADLSLSLPIATGGASGEIPIGLTQLFKENQKTWPDSDTNAGYSVQAYKNGETFYLVAQSPNLPSTAEGFYFFEDNTGTLDESGYPLSPSIDSNGAQNFAVDGNTLQVALTKSEWGPESTDSLAGVLQTPDGSFYFESEIILGPPPANVTQAEASEPLAQILVWGFLGGMILNLMPCVFPVIGIKIMGFVNQAGEDSKKIVAHGLAFTAGVLISSWTLAGIFIAVRTGGESLGWGFQFEDPATLYVLTIIFLVFAMNMSGVFEFGTSVMNVGQGSAQKSGLIGTFFSGILATVVSTPCSGPFLGSALGAVIALPDFSTMLVFTTIAMGLSTPYLLLSIFPKAIRLLPRPGAWMETLKQGLAFLLYGSAAFFLAVFGGTTLKNDAFDSNTHIIASLALTIIALGIWVYGRWAAPYKSKKRKTIGSLIAATFIIFGTWAGYPRQSVLTWETWSVERIQEARENGETVYVDFTATWCATCQTNKILAVNRKPVIERVLNQNIVMLKADWTDFDPEITDELARFQRNAVPFNLVYGPGADEPLILPEVLTSGIILDAFDEVQVK